MITLKTYEIEPLFESLQELNRKDWSPGMGYKISKLKKTVAEHYKDFDESRRDRVRRHAEKDEEGNPISVEGHNDQVKIEDMEALYRDLNELGQEEVRFDLPVNIKLDDFQGEDVKLKGEIMEGLIPIL